MRRKTKPLSSVSLCTLAGLLLLVFPAQGQESERADQPAPSSVRDMAGSLQRGWEPGQRRAARFPRLAAAIEKLHPFFFDGSLVLKPRTYYFDRDREDGTRSRAWAVGGSLDYRSDWWNDFLSIGAELYDSEKLEGEDDEAGTGLLQPVQEGYTVLGRAYMTLRYNQQEAVLFRQALDLPYLNGNDSRMTPNTFEAYTLSGAMEPGRYLERINYVAGYVDKIKPRNAEKFIDMAEAAGVSGADRGLVTAGARFQVTEHLAMGGINHYVDDVINMAFAATDFTCDLTDEVGLRLESQFSHQAGVGSDLLTGDSFDTWNLGVRAAVSFRKLILKTAFSTTDNGDHIRNPYGSYPGYLSLMQKDFNRAGEDAWLVGASYHFEDWGLEGLSMFANYAEGSDARAMDGVFSGDQREFDITADYRAQAGVLRGAWLRVRWSTLDLEGVRDDSTEVRVTANYELPIF